MAGAQYISTDERHCGESEHGLQNDVIPPGLSSFHSRIFFKAQILTGRSSLKHKYKSLFLDQVACYHIYEPIFTNTGNAK
jgi:hypothetical protein